jgi:hypothetical protein
LLREPVELRLELVDLGLHLLLPGRRALHPGVELRRQLLDALLRRLDALDDGVLDRLQAAGRLERGEGGGLVAELRRDALQLRCGRRPRVIRLRAHAADRVRERADRRADLIEDFLGVGQVGLVGWERTGG